jgi:hypothetical protein
LQRPGSRAESFAETDADGRNECGRDERRHCEEAIADEAIQIFLSVSSGLPRRCAARNDDFLV